MTERRFLTAPQVRARYGDISAVTLWRWLKEPARRFPKPHDFPGARFKLWAEDDLDAYDEAARPSEAA